jgi:hypothetical protein
VPSTVRRTSNSCRAPLGPRVLDGVADDFVKHDLQLDQRLAGNTVFGGDSIQSVAQDGQVGPILADGQFGGPQFGGAPFRQSFPIAKDIYA